MRHESKFVFPLHAYADFESCLRASRFFFSEIYHERRINNIYLDTQEYKNLFENLHGVQNREKHRIRWYGGEKNIRKPILEYKIKHGEMGYKEYYPLPAFLFDTTFNYDDYLEQIKFEPEMKIPQYQLMLDDIHTEVPTLFNTYLRRYFLSADGRFRLTIDHGLAYQTINRWFAGLVGFSEDKMVVELKYENNDVHDAGKIMQELGLRLARNSKYVIGMQGLYFNLFE